MPSRKNIKGDKCLVCQTPIPKHRLKRSLTCRRDCSKVYQRVNKYIRDYNRSKQMIENRKLKEELRVIKDAA